MTALAGWWAIPFGPFFTIRALIQNAAGGRRHPALDNSLLLMSARAFAARDNLPLAYALARQAQKASSVEDMHLAEEVIQTVQAKSKAPSTVRLVNPWKVHASDVLAHLGMAAVTPAFVAVSVLVLLSLAKAEHAVDTQLSTRSSSRLSDAHSFEAEQEVSGKPAREPVVFQTSAEVLRSARLSAQAEVGEYPVDGDRSARQGSATRDDAWQPSSTSTPPLETFEKPLRPRQ
jgi:hypothetical protein